jgi:uncharacterized lipoprotein YddW (UPF0748 family)
MKKVFSVIISLCLLLCSCVSESTTESTQKQESGTAAHSFTAAMWISYRDLAELLDGADSQIFTERIIQLAGSCTEVGINTLIVHAVAFCDAFYESSILPYSKYVCANQDNGCGFDPFGIICSVCADKGIDVEAWINPYRVLLNGTADNLSDGSPVRKWLEEDSETDSIIYFNGGIFLNPASRQANALILSVAREIAEKYRISAIHIDDYFYPSDDIETDKKSYESYTSQGGALSLSDWRRANVTGLIYSLHFLAKEKGIALSVSPAADISKDREKLFADIPFWIENGLADEIIPQIYFGFENEKMPFEKCLDEWISLCDGKDVRLVIGLAFYKNGTEDTYAGTGKNEWLENSDVISRQVSLILRKNTIYGVAFFSYSYIFGKNTKKMSKKELQILKSML